ncbi:MAG: hypothetical protein M1348_02995 [Candidatus Parvarchaeota archaeon]|jgi:hypothetical protein|nr:hypothetical protein [Candidatus Parvarchaeota archaeon]MCL5101552.1 hypothetical protein [Candidatus Parvarchaeota archaeon]
MAKSNKLAYEIALARVFFGLIFLGVAIGISIARILGLSALVDIVFIVVLSAFGLGYMAWASMAYNKRR